MSVGEADKYRLIPRRDVVKKTVSNTVLQKASGIGETESEISRDGICELAYVLLSNNTSQVSNSRSWKYASRNVEPTLVCLESTNQ